MIPWLPACLLHLEERFSFTGRSHYPRKLVLANARSGKTRPTQGSRAGPTTHLHSRIKHKCHLPMPEPHEPRASPTSSPSFSPSSLSLASSLSLRSSLPPRVSLLLIPWLPLLPGSVILPFFLAVRLSFLVAIPAKNRLLVQREGQPFPAYV